MNHQIQVRNETANRKEGKFNAYPEANRNNCMMEHVEEAYMGKFFPQYEENGVEKIEKSRYQN